MKPSLVRWMSGLFLVAVSTLSALANADYSYVFTANPGQVTWYNGTTIQIDATYNPYNPPYDQSCFLISMHMFAEIDMAPWAGGYGYGPAPASLTPSSYSLSSRNSFPISLTDMNIAYAYPSGWGGEFDRGWGGAIPFDCPALDFVIEGSQVGLYIESGGLAPESFITTPASGTWALVPDAGGSFELLATAMAALGTGHLFLRRSEKFPSPQ
jgi:hypothetical protein